jgi:hypothetical protein
VTLNFNVNSMRKTEKTSQRKFNTRRYLKMVLSLERNQSAPGLLNLVPWCYDSLSICKASCEPQFAGVCPTLLHAKINNLLYSRPTSDARHQEHDPKVDRATNTDKNMEDTYLAVGADLGIHGVYRVSQSGELGGSTAKSFTSSGLPIAMRLSVTAYSQYHKPKILTVRFTMSLE